MPLFDFNCRRCGRAEEVFTPKMEVPEPVCCGGVMTRLYSADRMKIKMGYPMWVDRIDDIHKAQADRGEKLRLPHPKEVGAT